jgi:hypothetical protein
MSVANSLRMSVRSRARLAAGAGIAVLACALLTGCSGFSHVVADNWPRALGGLPEGVPPRGDPPPMPAVHELPPPRDTARMTPEERKKYEEELRSTRTQATTEGEDTRNTAPGR